MKLTKGDYCTFSITGRWKLIKQYGKKLKEKKIKKYYLVVYVIWDFLVEVIIDNIDNKIVKIEPILNTNWLQLYD